ncbi:ABC transporter permease [Aquibacillus rhizosphaerae]|uniref:ABC transporter permease n=1 Tax=Aquibacillus rhizosphaerae TaxID=3051431 RepID=A0ABT7LA17_9BACI|nr:ABC transporter permease [Aquibacillus sp. LR5S19]MDL4842092.1 ABC transporter permease [Aquibacillus sp. LR5S19]
MKSILMTRWMHWRKQWLSLIVWLLLPILATAVFITVADQWQEDTKIPIGLVVEDDSTMAEALVQSIGSTSLLQIERMDKNQALVKLEQHELDSVFVIEDGYQDNIKENNRNEVITAYSSDMSIAYMPAKETVASYVQQDAGSSKAALTIKEMVAEYDTEMTWTWEEIVETSNQIRKEQSLLHSSFSFYNQKNPIEGTKEISLWNIWGVWSLFAFFTTFFIFDWVIKEKQSRIKVRLSLLRFSFKAYLLKNWCIYLALFILFDLINASVLVVYFDQPVEGSQMLAMIGFRLTMCMAAFLFAQCFKTSFYYYIAVIPVTLFMAIIGGALIPIDGLSKDWSWITYLSPIQAFLEGNMVSGWMIVLLIIFFIWYWRKEKAYA